MKEEISVIESVLDTHPDVFSPDVIDFTKIIHGYSHGVMRSIIIEGLTDPKPDRAYAMIACAVSEYLQHLLTSLHEYNNNLVTKLSPPFVCMAAWCANYAYPAIGFTPIIKRAEFFKNLNVSNSFMLKNYTEKPELYDEVFNALAPSGIMVTREETVD